MSRGEPDLRLPEVFRPTDGAHAQCAARKDAERAARLDTELRDLDASTATTCARLRQKEITLSGLPDRKSKIVERRAPAPEPEPVDPRQLALEAMFGSQEAQDAIDAAYDCENIEQQHTEAGWGHFDEDGEPLNKEKIEEEMELASVRYKHALKRLKAAFPRVLNDCTPEGVCAHRRPCSCGRGQRGAWPWVVQTPARGYCEQSWATLHQHTPRGLISCPELDEERARWLWQLAWGAEAARAKCLPNGERWMQEKVYREKHERFRRELYCGRSML